MPTTEKEDDGFSSLIHAYHERAGHKFLETRMVYCEKHGSHSRDIFVDPDGKLHGDACGTCAIDAAAHQSMIEQAKEMRAARYGQAEIPLRFKERRLDNFIADTPGKQKVLSACMDYAENFKQILTQGTCMIFTGNVGTGKTHLAAGVANAIMAAGFTARFSTVSGAVRRVRETWKTKEQEQQAIDVFCDPNLLILDEVGMQSGSDNEAQIIFEILNARYERMLPTIIISNLPLSGGEGEPTVRSYLGDRITDRLREGGGRAFVFDWESGRGK